MFFRDPHAGIRDHQLRLAVSLPYLDPHLSPFRGVLDRVVQEDGEGLTDAGSIEGCDDLAPGWTVLDGDLTSGGSPGGPPRLGDNGAEVLRFELERSLFVALGQSEQ